MLEIDKVQVLHDFEDGEGYIDDSGVDCDSESVFEVGRKEMDRYWCSLRAETVEVIVCTNDWLRNGGKDYSGELMRRK